MMAENVSLVMPTYQGAGWLKDTLPALRKQNYAAELEIIAIDSSSTDRSPELLKEYGAKLTTIPQASFSHGYARNLGVHLASYPIIIFMSQDVLPIGSEWLAGLVSLLDDTSIGAAHVRQHPRAEATPLEIFFHEQLYPAQSKRFTMKTGEAMTLDKLFFSNVCSVTWRDLALRFPFPENLIMSEDQAFAKMLLQAGYDTLYSAEVGVIHSHHYDIKTLFRRNFDSAYSLKGITDDSFASNATAGLNYIAKEIAFLAKGGHWGWLAYLPFYEAARILARILGAQAQHIPLPLREKLSLHRRFWYKETAIS
jgi:rhamnosyltransferase